MFCIQQMLEVHSRKNYWSYSKISPIKYIREITDNIIPPATKQEEFRKLLT